MSPRASYLYTVALAALAMVTTLTFGVTWAPIILSVMSQATLNWIGAIACGASVALTAVRTSYWLRDRQHTADKAAL